jgi:hypothetical protein
MFEIIDIDHEEREEKDSVLTFQLQGQLLDEIGGYRSRSDRRCERAGPLFSHLFNLP